MGRLSNLDHTPTADLLDQLVAHAEAAALRRAARDIELIAQSARVDRMHVDVIVSILRSYADTTTEGAQT